MKKKNFTLIELIVVIVIMGILAAIVLPNVQDMKKESYKTAIIGNVSSWQTAVDWYRVDNSNSFPSKEEPTVYIPQPISFSKLKLEYIRNLPKTPQMKYWVDYQGKVWASSIDSPQNVRFEGDILKWDKIDDADFYNVYLLEESNLEGSLYKGKYKLKLISPSEVNNLSVEGERSYVVSSVDEEGFESPPSGIGYKGYKDEYLDISHIPTVNLEIKNTDIITNKTELSWAVKLSNEDEIKEEKWFINGVESTKAPNTLPAGINSIKLSVLTSQGIWTKEVVKEVHVQSFGFTPSKVSNAYGFPSAVSNVFKVIEDSNGNFYYFEYGNQDSFARVTIYYSIYSKDLELIKDKTVLEEKASIFTNNQNVKFFDIVFDEFDNMYFLYGVGYNKHIKKYNKEGQALTGSIQVNTSDVYNRENYAITYKDGYVYTLTKGPSASYITKYDASLNRIYQKAITQPSRDMVESSIVILNDKIYISTSYDSYSTLSYNKYFIILNENDGSYIHSKEYASHSTSRIGILVLDSNEKLWMIEGINHNTRTINANIVNTDTLSIEKTILIESGVDGGNNSYDALTLENGNIMIVYPKTTMKYKLLTQ